MKDLINKALTEAMSAIEQLQQPHSKAFIGEAARTIAHC